jgi:tetratricopeptide (TPR) repeat protein
VRWTASCMQTPLVDMLGRFATAAQTDIRWVSVDTAVRDRPTSMRVRRVTGQRLCELATGSAGLIVRFTGDSVNIYDPAACDSLKQQRDLLISEAIVIWRRLFLLLPTDDRVADGHFALALLQECSGDVVGAIGEYRSMARKFSTSRLAPQALLEGAKLRIGLSDYTGARKELLTLLDTYPGSSTSSEAYAALGEATIKAGESEEAFRVFKKLFFLSQSHESRLSASLGAGRALYEQGKYEPAVKWLGDHILLSAGGKKGDLSQAYLLLNRCYALLGETKKAILASQSVLATDPTPSERMEACLSLASAWRSTGDLPRALGASFKVFREAPSGLQKYQSMLMIAGIYRQMGLSDKGATFINANMMKVSDRQMRAMLRIEQARCYRDAGRLTNAYDILIQAPEMLSPGRDAREAACDLGEVCLQIGRPAQAIIVALAVLKGSPTGFHSKRARKVLADAYLEQKDYENAAATLSGMSINQLGAKQ